jgi:acyl-CoA thioester hydrolase
MSEFAVAIRPRYSEVDSMGVVYHANYLVYFDVARTEWLRSAGADYAALERRGFRLAVVDLAVRYLLPAHFDDELSLAVWLTELRRASVTFRYSLRNGDGQVLCDGHTRLGCLNRENRPTRLPADTLKTLEEGRLATAVASEDP